MRPGIGVSDHGVAKIRTNAQRFNELLWKARENGFVTDVSSCSSLISKRATTESLIRIGAIVFCLLSLLMHHKLENYHIKFYEHRY
jgi:hypothetical protein